VTINYLDLFSGIGGFALGAKWAGIKFKKHYFSEVEPFCERLYKKRFPKAIALGDIREIDGKALVADANRSGFGFKRSSGVSENCDSSAGRDADGCDGSWILTGGFPCQDISVAGKGAGIKGSRSGLWWEYRRLIREIRPLYAIIENVGNLASKGLKEVLQSLAEIGYDAEWSDIRASDVGAPHRRERIWIVAYPHGSGLIERRGAESVREEQSALEYGREALANSESKRSEQEPERREQGQPVPVMGREADSNANGEQAGRPPESWHERGQWSVEPDVGRVAHGVPARVDKLRGLGNAIVPQIAQIIFALLREEIK